MGVFSHDEVCEGGFSIPDGVVGAKVDFELIDESIEIPHPMCGVGGVHKTRFKPTHRGAVQVREDEEDFLLVVEECMGTVSEVEVAGDQKTAEFPWVRTVESIGVADFGFFGSWGGRRSLVGCNAVCQLVKSS